MPTPAPDHDIVEDDVIVTGEKDHAAHEESSNPVD